MLIFKKKFLFNVIIICLIIFATSCKKRTLPIIVKTPPLHQEESFEKLEKFKIIKECTASLVKEPVVCLTKENFIIMAENFRKMNDILVKYQIEHQYYASIYDK